MHASGSTHFETAHRILRYLEGTSGKDILFKKHNNFQMEFYANADWAGSTTNKRSTSYCYSLLEETWLHGEAKRQMLWPKVVLKQSLKQWRVEFVKAFESKDT